MRSVEVTAAGPLELFQSICEAAGVPVGASRLDLFLALPELQQDQIWLEAGAPITWVKEQLGHSSIMLTVDLYGRWERQAAKEQAAKLEGAFAL